jgi:hypothetical protein
MSPDELTLGNRTGLINDAKRLAVPVCFAILKE